MLLSYPLIFPAILFYFTYYSHFFILRKVNNQAANYIIHTHAITLFYSIIYCFTACAAALHSLTCLKTVVHIHNSFKASPYSLVMIYCQVNPEFTRENLL